MNRRTLYVAAAFIAAAPFAAVVAWTGPTGAPPNNNTNGPVWLQTGAVTAQTGKISISGATINAATTTQDLYVATGKAIRADGAGATTFNFGNYGVGASAFTLGVYGNINVAGFGGANGTLTASQLCLPGVNPSGGCITSWPSGGGGPDIYVNTTGDTMSGTLRIDGNVGGAYTPLWINYGGGNTGMAVNATGTGGDGITVVSNEHAVLTTATNGYGLGANSANSHGVVGTTAAQGAAGGIFYNTNTGVNSVALYGIADNCVNGTSGCGGRGVSGSSANGIGVYGNAANQRSPGVYGFGFYGVQGAGLTGIRADGTSAFGVEGRGPVAGVIGYGTGGANTAGVRGENSVANAYGMYAINSAAGGRGLFAETSAANTQAIRGFANVSGGIGVQGEAGDANGVGVDGIASTGNSGAIGVRGQTNSPGGQGVLAISTNAAAMGLYARNAGTGIQSPAVMAYNTGSNGIGLIAYATSSGGTGIWSYGANVGLAGSTIYSGGVAAGVGVYGESGTGEGVRGATSNGNSGNPGVRGTSLSTSNGTGIIGEVTGSGNTGVGGIFSGGGHDVQLTNGRLNSAAATFSFRVAGTERMQLTNTSPYAYKTSGGSWGTISDARLKNIKGSFDRGLDELMKINTKYFTFNGKTDMVKNDNEMHVGVIAQEVQKVIPEAVVQGENGYFIVNNDPIIWTMLNSIKELKTENDSLKKKLNDMNARLEKLEAAQ